MIYEISGLISVVLAMVMASTIQYRKEKYAILAILTALPLFLVSAFRYGIGTDYFEYVVLLRSFKYTALKYTFSVNIEPLFFLMDKLILFLFGENAQWFFILSSGIILYSVFWVIYRDSKNPAESVFLYITMTFFLSSMNTTREHIACCILMIALKYVYEDKFMKFFSIVAIAGLFHYSAFSFLVIYPLKKIVLTPKKVATYTLGLFVLQGTIASIILGFLRYTRYARYLEGETNYTVAGILGIVIQLSILIFASYYYNQCKNNADEKKARIFNILYGCQMLATWCTILSGIIPLISRIKWIFSYPSILLIPFILNNIYNKKEREIVRLAINSAFLVYYFVVIYVSKSYGVLPYKAVY